MLYLVSSFSSSSSLYNCNSIPDLTRPQGIMLITFQRFWIQGTTLINYWYVQSQYMQTETNKSTLHSVLIEGWFVDKQQGR